MIPEHLAPHPLAERGTVPLHEGLFTFSVYVTRCTVQARQGVREFGLNIAALRSPGTSGRQSIGALQPAQRQAPARTRNRTSLAAHGGVGRPGRARGEAWGWRTGGGAALRGGEGGEGSITY